MAKKKRGKFSNFFWFFYAFVALAGLLGIVEAVFLLLGVTILSEASGRPFLFLFIFANFLSLFIIALHIVAIRHFVKNKYPKITWVLPIYTLSLFAIILIISIFFSAILAFAGVFFHFWFILLTSSFEFIFAGYVMYKFKKQIRGIRERKRLFKVVSSRIAIVLLATLIYVIYFFVRPEGFNTTLYGWVNVLLPLLIFYVWYKTVKSLK